ncbi:serine/threonine protein kinase [Paenarthrobacter sp. NCHU4564]|uniref:serine/threonine protein kinase n=1 Tax=Paenarthrobacter sp. NCHU4564 TaxID=3451353 RepID=UPI003F9E5E10
MASQDNSREPVPGIPGFSLSRKLGQGGSSAVWLAVRDSDQARFAVKCLLEERSTVPPDAGYRAEAAALREFGIMSLVQHDHLLKVHGLVQQEVDGTEKPVLLMDYAAGGSVAGLVQSRGSLRVGETVTILTPMAQVLEYLHGQGTVHGDVSPGNILFTAEGKPLLGDLGIAAMVGDAPTSQDVGTPGFADSTVTEPEEQGFLRPSRDIHALAAVGWFCLTGSPPEGPEVRPPLSLLVPEVPRGLVTVLEAGLDPDPAVRPSAREFTTAVYRSAAAEPVDLVGSVHPSVIPELLTQRNPEGRVRRPARVILALRRVNRWRRPCYAGPAGRSKPKSMPARFSRGPAGRRADRRRGVRPAGLGLALVVGALLVAALTSVSVAIWAVGQERPRAVQASTHGIHHDGGSPGAVSPDVLEALASNDPVVAVRALSAVRDTALREQNHGLLSIVNAQGSPAEAADGILAAQLAAEDLRLTGLRTELGEVRLVEAVGNGRMVVGLRATVSAFGEQAGGNSVVQERPQGSPQDLRLVLVKDGERWKIFQILGPA